MSASRETDNSCTKLLKKLGIYKEEKPKEKTGEEILMEYVHEQDKEEQQGLVEIPLQEIKKPLMR